MRNKAVVFSVLLILVVSLVPYSLASQNKVDVLIGFNGKPDDSVVRAFGGDVNHNFAPFINVIAASVPERALEGLAHNPNIAYVEPDAEAHIMDHASTTHPLEYENSWGVDHIGSYTVHTKSPSYNKGDGIKVCVIDTGINRTHPDLDGNYVTGIDYVNDDDNPMDDNGHGTHVSGTIAAELNNAGVVGVAPNADLIVAKVLNSAGSGSYSDVIAGINWCASNGAKVISMSLGGSSGSDALKSAVDTAYSKNILVVAAAGNSGNKAGKNDSVIYPARYDSVIAVAATDSNNKRASWSSTGPKVEISAPGVSVKSTWLGTGYSTISGTSMATPHVSGVAALIWKSNPNLSSGDVRNILDSTALDLGASGRDNLYGYGLVRANVAVP
jgi:subtilisin family serine protease